MDNLRRRIPYVAKDDDLDNLEDEILDEQQQDELIDRLKKENEDENRVYTLALKVVVGLSIILQFFAFKQNPLLVIYPIKGAQPSIPLPAVFILLSLYIHLNFLFLLFSEEVRVYFQLSGTVDPLSFQLLYSLSAVAPTLCIFSHKPWQTMVWWCITPIMVFIVETVIDTIHQSTDGVAELESKKYRAPGA